ncbi:MAG TPA: hypothetical protein GX532_04700 [Clostridia bacterium]|nr:hypothetical protein [Clostridia bacterium]
MKNQQEEISLLTKLNIMQVVGHIITLIGGVIILFAFMVQTPLLEEQERIIKRLKKKIMNLCSQITLVNIMTIIGSKKNEKTSLEKPNLSKITLRHT